MKGIKIAFIIIVMGMLAFPFIFADRGNAVVSEEENRMLNQRPLLLEDGKINETFTYDYEEWFLDNLGLRSQLTNLYSIIQYYVFDNIFWKFHYIPLNLSIL